ncbi:MAG: hypothetical protein JWN24_2401 [Phycisphaerales bacterium]|nr:hypothetical protein [Phycisphaerales bacterium]
MELSQQQFAEITGFCVLPVAGGAPSDRRKYARVPFGSRARISSLQEGIEGIDSVVVIRDISIAGMSLLYSEPMEAGEEFVIQFSGEHGWPARILCCARRCESGGSGGTQYIIGASFEMVIESAEVGAGISDGRTAKAGWGEGQFAECAQDASPSWAAEARPRPRATLPQRVHQFLQQAVKAAYMGLFGTGAHDGF